MHQADKLLVYVRPRPCVIANFGERWLLPVRRDDVHALKLLARHAQVGNVVVVELRARAVAVVALSVLAHALPVINTEL